MFEMKNAQDARVTHGRYKRLILESEHVTPNADAEYEQGFLSDGKFISLGVATVHIQNQPAKPEERDADDNITVEAVPASTDYDDFISGLKSAKSSSSFIEEYIKTRV